MRIKPLLLVGVPWVLLGLLSIGVVRFVWFGRGEVGRAPPAEWAPEAPKWVPQYGVPVDAVIENVPEVPDKLRGPSPPIKDDS